jgi:DNA-3-methyladenine glycosylase I
MINRCTWARGSELEQIYHDNVWGRPCYDDNQLFRKLILDTMQAGLSWITILKKEKAFDEAFDGFDLQKIVAYDNQKISELMNNSGIIRNKLKILSVISNAKAFLDIQKAYGSFKDYLWAYVDFKPINHHIQSMDEIPAFTPLSVNISDDLKKRGFKFVGPTVVYAYMQAIGMVNDHEVSCDFYQDIV